jgi:small subunit ribosomal protein S27Ae
MQMWKKYGGAAAKGKWCPRCGPGTFLAVHKNRVHCGKCGYAEIQK